MITKQAFRKNHLPLSIFIIGETVSIIDLRNLKYEEKHFQLTTN